uniref:Skp1_POZ domain-containing protein n=1 Tax=Panagrellus redivivus TaxID=6233 RepID=A0A7E4VZM9_PANRE
MASNDVPTLKVEDNSGRLTVLGPEVIRECKVLAKAAFYSDTSEVCPIQVDPEVLDLVIEFSMLFKDEPDYTTIKGTPIDAPEWDTSPAMQFFTRFDNNEIFWLMKTLDYLQAQRFIDHAVFYICRQTQGMSDQEKLVFFGLAGDQPEEPSPEISQANLGKGITAMIRSFIKSEKLIVHY